MCVAVGGRPGSSSESRNVTVELCPLESKRSLGRHFRPQCHRWTMPGNAATRREILPERILETPRPSPPYADVVPVVALHAVFPGSAGSVLIGPGSARPAAPAQGIAAPAGEGRRAGTLAGSDGQGQREGAIHWAVGDQVDARQSDQFLCLLHGGIQPCSPVTFLQWYDRALVL